MPCGGSPAGQTKSTVRGPFFFVGSLATVGVGFGTGPGMGSGFDDAGGEGSGGASTVVDDTTPDGPDDDPAP